MSENKKIESNIREIELSEVNRWEKWFFERSAFFFYVDQNAGVNAELDKFAKEVKAQYKQYAIWAKKRNKLQNAIDETLSDLSEFEETRQLRAELTKHKNAQPHPISIHQINKTTDPLTGLPFSEAIKNYLNRDEVHIGIETESDNTEWFVFWNDNDNEEKNLLKANAVYPRGHIYSVSKAAKDIQESPEKYFKPDGYDLPIQPRDWTDIITTHIVMFFDKDDEKYLQYNKELLNPFDWSIINSIATVWYYSKLAPAPLIITVTMIYQILTGNPKARPSKKQADQIITSMNKLSALNVAIRATDEMVRVKHKEVREYIYRGRMIVADQEDEILTGGKVTTGFIIYREPLIFKYCCKNKQYTTVPQNLLATRPTLGKRFTMTEQNIVIRDYFIRRIAEMKRSKSLSRSIRLDTVYLNAGLNIDDLTKDARQTIRDTCFDILNDLKTKGYIKGFDQYNGRGRSIIGYKVEV